MTKKIRIAELAEFDPSKYITDNDLLPKGHPKRS